MIDEGIVLRSPRHEVERRMAIVLPIPNKANFDATDASLEDPPHLAPTLRAARSAPPGCHFQLFGVLADQLFQG